MILSMFKNISDETKAVLGFLLIPISFLILKENWSNFDGKYDKIIFTTTFVIILWSSIRIIYKVFKNRSGE